MVQIRDGIGYSEKAIYRSDALKLTSTADGTTQAVAGQTQQDQSNTSPWAMWGSDNRMPITMADHLENCGVLSAAIDAKSRIAAGKGIQPFTLDNVTSDGKEELTWVSDAEIQDWLEENAMFDKVLDFSYDKNAYGWRAGSYILDAKRQKINRITRKDVFECRLQKKSTQGFINSLYLCGDWAGNSQQFNKNAHVQIPALKEGFELADLTSRSSGFEFAFIDRRRRNGRQYYPFPLWYATQEWVKIARAVPGMKNTQFKRQITLQYLVTISEKYFTTQYSDWNTMDNDKKVDIVNKKYDEIDTFLSGSDNSFKSITSLSYIDPISGKEIDTIKIEAIDDKNTEGKMLPDSAAANSEILFAVMVNPALLGAGQPGGPYSNNAGGSNIRESYMAQIMLMEEERKMNAAHMNVVKRFNGWDKKFSKPLVFRYQSGLLTTLDTGKSSKPENL